MPITLRQPGGAKAAAAAGSIIGKAQRAEEDRARTEREQVRKTEDKARMKAQETAMAWELQKMQMRSQKEFEKELRQYDYQLMRDDRAEMWTVEKMEMASRMDFEREEQERQQNLSRIDAKILTLKKAKDDGQFTGREPEYKAMVFDLEQQQYGIKNPRALPKEPKPRSAASQVSEIDATLELEGYTQQDLIDAGLDPTDFPGIAANEDAVEIAIREQVTQVEQQGGQIAFNENTGEYRASYDGGNTWESLGVVQEEIPEEPTQGREKFLRQLLLSKPFEKILKHVNVPFGSR